MSKLLLAIESDFYDNVSIEFLSHRTASSFSYDYYAFDGVIMYRDCVVVPVALRGTVLKALHAAHQVVSAMERRAKTTVLWSGMTQDINNIRNFCVHCNRNARFLEATPPMPINLPTTPFEHIFADYFDYGGLHFLVIRIKFSYWTDVFGTSLGSNICRLLPRGAFHLRPATAQPAEHRTEYKEE